MNVLLADHHPVFRKGIQEVMKNGNYHFVGMVENGSNLLATIKDSKADLVILELDLPDANGIGTLRDIKEEYPEVKTLVLSSYPEDIYALSAVKAGASGYMCKTRTAQEIQHAINCISDGEVFISPDVMERVKHKKNQTTEKPYRKLSTREIEVLNLLSRGKRNKEISLLLNINEKTVSTYKTRLLKKMHVNNIADLIHQSRLLQITGEA